MFSSKQVGIIFVTFHGGLHNMFCIICQEMIVYFNYWLLAGTLPANKLLLTGTVLANKLLLAGTVPDNKFVLAGTTKKLKFQKISPPP